MRNPFWYYRLDGAVVEPFYSFGSFELIDIWLGFGGSRLERFCTVFVVMRMLGDFGSGQTTALLSFMVVRQVPDAKVLSIAIFA